MTVQIDTTAVTNGVRLVQQTAHPSSPASGFEQLYVISGSPHGGLFLKDSSGRQIGPFITGSAGGGGSSTSLSYDKKTLSSGDLNTTSTSFADIHANLNITISTGARRCKITFTGNGSNNNTSQTQIDVELDGSRLGQAYGLSFGGGVSGANFPLSFSIITDVLSAGSHTFKPQWRVDGNTGTLYASTTVTPIVFSVEELPDLVPV